MAKQAIFITGAASGIGRAMAQKFAAEGWFCGLADVNEAGLAETAALLPSGQSFVVRLDVREPAAWSSALAAFDTASQGGFCVLANNAGIARGGPFEAVSAADHDQLIDINFRGVVNGCQAALPFLKGKPGAAILNTGSASGIYGAAGLAVYSATKFAVRGLTEALDLEFAPIGIKVRSIMPSFIDTPLLAVGISGSNRTARDGVVGMGLEFTPVEVVAERAFAALQGDKVHTLVGKTAERIAFWAKWSPQALRKRMRANLVAAAARRAGGA
jgi:NAD(P)-dependent dehydrogenase (short-subunit alcohol dehydrogenase family)